jgi:hypothetical protein
VADLHFDGTPKAGDTFTLSSNSGATADNGNALALAKLQTAKTINGTSSFNDAYASLVNQVGSDAKSASIASSRRTASPPGYVGAAVGVRREHGRGNGEPAQVPAALPGECEGHPDGQHDHRHALSIG